MAGVAETSGGSEPTRAPRTAAVLRILASLAPDRRQPVYDVSGQGAAPMAWVGPLRSVVESGEPFRMNDGDLANRSTNDVTGFVAVKRSPELEAPHLFNVLVTRARRRLVVLASIDDPPPGLLADYLRWADAPMAPAEGGPAADEWTARLAEVLGDAGVAIRTGYPVGRWLVDLVVGSGTDAVAVATGVYRDGSAAHIRRHLCLARLGWRQGEAFPTSHDGDPVAAALALAGQDGRPWKR